MTSKRPFEVYAFPCLLLVLVLATSATPCFADFESSLRGLKTQLTGTILPVLSVMGLGFAALSFFTGNPQAKQHIFYAILGCIFGFGAQAIVDFISSTVH